MTPEQLVPERCLPFPDSYPRFTVFSVRTWNAVSGCAFKFGPEELSSVRSSEVALSATRLTLTVKDGAGRLFAATWTDGRWSPQLLAFRAQDVGKWTEIPVQQEKSHMRRMTSEQIETELTAICNQKRGGVHDTAMAIAREAFTVGQDNGKQIILEAVDSLIAKPIGDVEVEQLGRAMRDIFAWCAAKPTRFFGGTTMMTTYGGQVGAHVYKADDEPADDCGSRTTYKWGDSAAEALSRLATWCNEDTAQQREADQSAHESTQQAEESAVSAAALDAKFGAVEHADTQPPPPPEPTQPENEAPDITGSAPDSGPAF